MKKGKWVAFGFAMLCAAIWGSYTLIALKNGSLFRSIGVISGADGPTAVYTVTASGIPNPLFIVLSIVFIIALAVWLILRHIAKKRS